MCLDPLIFKSPMIISLVSSKNLLLLFYFIPTSKNKYQLQKFQTWFT